MKVAGYDYEAFGRGVIALDGPGCFAYRLLLERRRVLRAGWEAARADGRDVACRDWPTDPVLRCGGIMDAHHLLPKTWLKSEFPHGVNVHAEFTDRGDGVTDEVHVIRPLAALLNDPRNGIIACRDHHDRIENARIPIYRADLPARVWEFAAELGDRAVARLERDYPERAPAAGGAA